MDIFKIIVIIWFLFQICLTIFAWIDIYKSPYTKYLSKLIWAIIVLFFNIFGTIAYFVIGRTKHKKNDAEKN